MQSNGLCEVVQSEAEVIVRETDKGRQTVRHLYDKSVEQGQAALGPKHQSDLHNLASLLRRIIANTDSP